MSWGAPKKIEIHIYQHGGSGNDGLADLKGLIQSLHQKVDNMPTNEEFEAAFAEVDTATTEISADITDLLDQIQNSGLTPAQQQDKFDKLRAHAERLKAIAASVETPVPPPIGTGGTT